MATLDNDIREIGKGILKDQRLWENGGLDGLVKYVVRSVTKWSSESKHGLPLSASNQGL